MWFQTYFTHIETTLLASCNLLDSDGVQTILVYQTDLDKVRCFIFFKSNIHNMNGIFLAIAFTA